MSEGATDEFDSQLHAPGVNWRDNEDRDSPTTAGWLLSANADRIDGLMALDLRSASDLALANDLLGIPTDTKPDVTAICWYWFADNVIELNIADAHGFTLNQLAEHLRITSAEADTAEVTPEISARILAKIQAGRE